MIAGTRWNVDRLGAVASAACAVHCAITGAAMGVLSVLGLGFFGSVWTDVAFFAVAIVAGSIAVRMGWRRHRSLAPAGLFVGGLALLAVAHAGFREGSAPEATLSVLGGFSLVAFHGLNWRLIHLCGACGCSHGDLAAPVGAES